jgi:hypothetical protein
MKLLRVIAQDARAVRFETLVNTFVYGVGLLGLLAVANGVHRMHEISIWHF